MSKATNAAELLGTLEALSGLSFPHAAEAEVLGGVDVYGVDVTLASLRGTRTVSVIDFGGLEREMVPDAWTDALQSEVATALSERPVETGPLPPAARAALEARGYHGPEPDEHESVRWRHLRVDVVLIALGPMGEPLFVLVAREPTRWLGTISRTAVVRDRVYTMRGVRAPTPWTLHWFGGTPRRNAAASALLTVCAAGVTLWAATTSGASSFVAGVWASVTLLAASPLLFDRYGRKALFAGGGECRCLRCEGRRDRGAAQVATEAAGTGGWGDLHTVEADDGAPGEEPRAAQLEEQVQVGDETAQDSTSPTKRDATLPS